MDTVSQRAAAVMLRVSRGTIVHMTRDGRLPTFRTDARGRRKLDRATVEAYARGVKVQRA